MTRRRWQAGISGTLEVLLVATSVALAVGSRTAHGAPTDLEMAMYYAPVIYQDVDTKWEYDLDADRDGTSYDENGIDDFIARVDYDSDWTSDNNWENLEPTVMGATPDRLPAYVYYSVKGVGGLIFIYYAVFHPRDWDDDDETITEVGAWEHENDMEAVLLTVQDDGTNGGYGTLIAANSMAHNYWFNYPIGNGVKMSSEFAGRDHSPPNFGATGFHFPTSVGGTSLPADQHLAIYSQSEGHGIFCDRFVTAPGLDKDYPPESIIAGDPSADELVTDWQDGFPLSPGTLLTGQVRTGVAYYHYTGAAGYAVPISEGASGDYVQYVNYSLLPMSELENRKADPNVFKDGAAFCGTSDGYWDSLGNKNKAHPPWTIPDKHPHPFNWTKYSDPGDFYNKPYVVIRTRYLVPVFNLSAMPSDGEVTLSWSLPYHSYNIYMSTSSSALSQGGTPNATYKISSADGPPKTITGLTNGQTYYFAVTVINHLGDESTYSNVVSATPQALGPVLGSAPSSLDFGVGFPNKTYTDYFYLINDGGGTLAWSASSDNARVTCSPELGNLAKGEVAKIKVTVNTNGMSSGQSISATVSVTSNGGDTDIPVDLDVGSQGSSFDVTIDASVHNAQIYIWTLIDGKYTKFYGSQLPVVVRFDATEKVRLGGLTTLDSNYEHDCWDLTWPPNAPYHSNGNYVEFQFAGSPVDVQAYATYYYAPKYSVSGWVTDSVTGKPIAGATVGDGSRNVTTDAEGDYTITRVPPNTYTVTASATGYSFTSQSVTVSSADQTGINFAGTDTVAPAAPQVSSTTHPFSTLWVSDSSPSFTWTTPADTSGITGYSYVLDQIASTTPDSTVDTTGKITSFAGIADGTWYFHVKAQDGAGNWGPAGHYELRIDVTPPDPITDLASTSHTVGTPSSDPTIDLTWTTPADSASEVVGCSVVWDQAAATAPDASIDIGNVTSLTSDPLIDGDWYCHIRSVDAAMNASIATARVGPFTLLGAPAPPSKPVSPNPGNGASDVSITATLGWSNGGGATSYFVYFGTDPTPDNSEYQGEQGSTTFDPGALTYGATYYWRIDAKNSTGTTTGDIWSFTTTSGGGPGPGDETVSPLGGGCTAGPGQARGYLAWAFSVLLILALLSRLRRRPFTGGSQN